MIYYLENREQVMKKVYFKPPPSQAYFKNGIFRIKSKHNTLWDMDKKLLSKGIIFNTIDMDINRDGDLYVYSEAPYPWELAMWQKVIATLKKNILFSLESPIVNPFSHLGIIHRFFNRVYTWDDSRVDNCRYFKFFIPQSSFGLNTKRVNFKKKKFLTFVNSKKDVPLAFLMLSPYKKNLYKERLVSLEFFSSRIPKNFDPYGLGWDKPIPWSIRERIFGVRRYASFKRGLGEDKIRTLADYRFCLCFENAIAPGYITEKIFDCFKARCVPIYWGAPNVEHYIDKQCFIDFREFTDYESLLRFMQNMSEETYGEYIKAIDRFMSKRSTQDNWFKDNFSETILKNLS